MGFTTLTPGDVFLSEASAAFADKARYRLVVAEPHPAVYVTAYATSRSTEAGFGARFIMADPGDFGLSLPERTYFTVERITVVTGTRGTIVAHSPPLLEAWRAAAVIGLGLGKGSAEKVGASMRRGRIMKITDPVLQGELRTKYAVAIGNLPYSNTLRVQPAVPLYKAPPGNGTLSIPIAGSAAASFLVTLDPDRSRPMHAAVALPTHLKDIAFDREDQNAEPTQLWLSSEQMRDIDVGIANALSLPYQAG